MNKFSSIFVMKKVEIWKTLKGIKSISKVIAFVMSWISMLTSALFWFGIVNDIDKMFDFLIKNKMYLEVMGNMVLISLYFSIAFGVITVFIKICMYLVKNKMSEDEMIKADIVQKRRYLKKNEKWYYKIYQRK